MSKKKVTKNDKGEIVPEVCPLCGSKVGLYIHGEPVYLCSNKKCGKYFGTMPFNLKEAKDKEVTYFKFKSNIEDFLTKLKTKPIKSEPSKFLKDYDFDKKKLTRILVNRGIVKRKESIKDPTNSDEKEVKYYVKYTIVRDGYEEKIKKLYNDYFNKQRLNECDGNTGSNSSCGDYTSDGSSSSGQYTTVFPGVMARPSYLSTRKKGKNNKEPKPENILGKTITAENMKNRIIRLTESQMKYILKNKRMLNEEGEGGAVGGATTTFSVGAETTRGDIGYDVPAFSKSKNGNTNKKEKGTESDFFKGALDRTPGLSCDRLDKNGNVKRHKNI